MANNLNEKDCYLEFKIFNKDIDYKTFTEILYLYSKLLIEYVIRAEMVRISHIGNFYIKKIFRGDKNFSIDWKNSERDENNKITKKVYHNSPWYVKFHLSKNVKLSGVSLKISRGTINHETNNKEKLKKALLNNPLLHLQFVASMKYKNISAVTDDGEVEIYSSFKAIPQKYHRDIKRYANTDTKVNGKHWKITVEHEDYKN